MNDRRQVLEYFEQQKDFLSEKVSSGIEQHRKGNAFITVTDQNGNPVPNARIRASQKSHEFKFGANLFMLDEFETPEKNGLYKKYFAELFNMATLPFYWDATEPEPGHTRYSKDSEKMYRRPPIDLCIEYCEAHGIEPREHALAYDAFFPKWLHGAPVETVKKALENRYREIAERYADKIPTIEVTNEMRGFVGKTPFYDDPDYITWCFETAAKYFPNNQLVANESAYDGWGPTTRVTDPYYAYLEAHLLKGVPIHAIGMQFHMFIKAENEYAETRRYYNPKQLYRHMDLMARLGKPFQVTEVTIPAYSNREEDENIQAELMELLYSIWFSYPNMEQIIYWNLVDGYAAFAPLGDMTAGENYYHGGLIRFDFTLKPAYHRIKNLIHNVWHTELDLTADEKGAAAFRGFYGAYDVQITVNGVTATHTINLSAKKDNIFTLTL